MRTDDLPKICYRHYLKDYFLQGFLHIIPGIKDYRVVKLWLNRLSWAKNKNPIAKSKIPELTPHTYIGYMYKDSMLERVVPNIQSLKILNHMINNPVYVTPNILSHKTKIVRKICDYFYPHSFQSKDNDDPF